MIITIFFYLFFIPISDDSITDEFYVSRIEAGRKAKDKKFKRKRSTPLKDFKQFKGLKYYEVDTDFVFKAKVEINEEPTVIEFSTSSGKARNYLSYARLSFSFGEEEYNLTLFQGIDRLTQLPIENYFFLPFTDMTNGSETYGGGRYIDIEGIVETEIILDFNRAYSPYCAYEEGFSCPIPPIENDLKLLVKAGEKAYK